MALKGVKILDFTRFQNGPAATVVLADLGATVIKVELPGYGDTGRSVMGSSSGFSGYFESLNRGKQSIELDLKHLKSRPILNKLIEWCDVLAENFKPNVMDKLGYGYEYCKAINPKIIYATNSGFGSKGPWSERGKERGSFDTISQAVSGAMVSNGGGRDHSPRLVEWGLADQIGGMNFAVQILSGIVARERNGGVGQKIECSQLGAMIQFQSTAIVTAMESGTQRNDGKAVGIDNLTLSYYKCRDGKWVSVAPMVEESHWIKFCKAVSLEDMLTDARSARPKDRYSKRNRDYVRQRLIDLFLSKPQQYWVDVLGPSGVPVGPVLDYQQVKNHPQMLANDYIVDVEHPSWGKISTVGVMGIYSETPAPPVGVAPALGEHTEEVLEKIVHLSKNEIEELKKDGVTTPNPNKTYVQPSWMKKFRKAKSNNLKSRL